MSSASNENDSPDPLIHNEWQMLRLEPASGYGRITGYSYLIRTTLSSTIHAVRSR